MLRSLIVVMRYLWASPYTLVGLWMLFAPWSGPRYLIRHRGTFGVVGPAMERILRWAPIDGGAAALTLGHTILAVSHETFYATWDHEAVHVRQYERWGPFFLPAYFFCGWRERRRGRDPYWDNPFEREARDGSR